MKKKERKASEYTCTYRDFKCVNTGFTLSTTEWYHLGVKKNGKTEKISSELALEIAHRNMLKDAADEIEKERHEG